MWQRNYQSGELSNEADENIHYNLYSSQSIKFIHWYTRDSCTWKWTPVTLECIDFISNIYYESKSKWKLYKHTKLNIFITTKIIKEMHHYARNTKF